MVFVNLILNIYCILLIYPLVVVRVDTRVGLS